MSSVPLQRQRGLELQPGLVSERRVAYVFEDSGASKLAIASLEGGEPVKTFELPATYSRPLHWTPDGHAVAYIDLKDGVSNIFAQPLDGGKPVQLTDFKADRIFSFAWSRDGKQLCLSRGTISSDVVLIKDFR